jgi:hypothetical protein
MFRQGRRGGSPGPPAGLGGIWEISFADYCSGRLACRAVALSRRPLRAGARRWRVRAHVGAVGAEARVRRLFGQMAPA